MYFHRDGSIGTAVLNRTSSDSGALIANRLLTASGLSGAGARARRSALVSVSAANSDAKTSTFRPGRAGGLFFAGFVVELLLERCADFTSTARLPCRPVAGHVRTKRPMPPRLLHRHGGRSRQTILTLPE